VNILQLQDRMKGLPDSALQAAATMPGGHQFLAMAELAERQRIRGAYANQAQQAQPTVAERIMGGNPVPPVESPRADIGGLAAASNRGDMQPALKMAQGGAVPSTYYMAEGGKVPEQVIVTAQQGQDQLDPYNRYNQMFGSGPYDTGLIDPARGNIGSLVDQLTRQTKEAMPEDRVAAMLAAQDQDRARNAEMEKRDRWLALAQAGAAMAAGNSPDFLTNVAGGAQAGLASLRQGMTEAEKRQAAVQTRGDALEKARMDQEARNAQAMQQVYGSGFQANSGVELAGLRAAGDMTAADIQNDAAMDRTVASIGADMARARLDAATRIKITQLNEWGQTSRASAENALRAQGIGDEKVARFFGRRDDIVSDIYGKYKLTDPATLASPDYQRILAAARKEYVNRVLPVAKAMNVNPDIVKDNAFGSGFAGGNNPAGKNTGAPSPTRNDGVIRD
jgi:hypothetical protein